MVAYRAVGGSATVGDAMSEADHAPDGEKVEDNRGEQPGLDAYPLDALLIRTEPRAIQDVVRRIDRGAIKLDPDFQREFLWSEERQSRLVESVLMRIPLPPFYLAESRDSTLVVVDGLQRLTTFRRFRGGALKLALPQNQELHGKSFDKLEPRLQDRFDDGPLTFYLIDPKIPLRVRLDIFDRVNSGVPLTRQQMRNALFNGPATRALGDLARSKEFLDATSKALSSERLRQQRADREAINRFFAYFVLGWNTYVDEAAEPGLAGNLDEFLGKALAHLNEPANSRSLEEARRGFQRSMQINFQVFGRHCFRKHERPNDRMKAFNLALFDVFSVGLARYPADRVDAARAEMLRQGFYGLMQDSAFHNAISYATAKTASVRARFERAEAMLTGVLGAPAY